MPLELRVSRRAAREIERVVQWWFLNRPAAPDAVSVDLKAAFELLTIRPDIGSLVTQASVPDVRRFYLERIRYWVYYRARANRLEVLSLWHAERVSGPSL
ncbi:MAG: type II toxin-antitoxin system RelE/ParE family toxin [Burkholderiales bacterium]|nr:type II toxin-antitoxin system RelE/ParE family toxin [Burkholderiales bacterium]